MLIQLKQPELISALKMYIAAMGINLAGKTVEITFTAGRNGTGHSAVLAIEEGEASAFDFEAAATNAISQASTSAATAVDPEASPIGGEPEPVADEAAPTKRTSLFGAAN